MSYLDADMLPQPQAIPPAARQRLVWIGGAVLLAVALVVAVVVTRSGQRSPRERLVGSHQAIESSSSYTFTITGALDAGATSITTTLDGRYDPKNNQGVVDFRYAAFNLHMVLAGRTAYIAVPPAAREKTEKKPWLAVDAADLFTGLNQTGVGQPVDPIEFVRSASAIVGKVRSLGPETVSGVATSHVRATVDLNAAAPNPDSLPGDVDVTGVPFDAWLDAHDRPLRQRFTLTFPYVDPLTRQSTSATVVTTVDATGYGARLHVNVPRPSQVFTLKDARQFGTYLTA